MYLLPPDMRDWLPGNHLVWFIMEIVSQLDLTAFYQHYNPKGEGRAAYHPFIMTALILHRHQVKQKDRTALHRKRAF
jgi:transposase